MIFSRTSSELQVIARNCDWFIAPSAPVVIGPEYLLWFWFFDIHLKTALSEPKRNCLCMFQKEVEDWRRPKNFNKALGEAQHLIESADMNEVKIFLRLVRVRCFNHKFC